MNFKVKHSVVANESIQIGYDVDSVHVLRLLCSLPKINMLLENYPLGIGNSSSKPPRNSYRLWESKGTTFSPGKSQPS